MPPTSTPVPATPTPPPARPEPTAAPESTKPAPALKPAAHVRVGVVEDKANDRWGFRPPVVEVAVGGTVVFVNDGTEEHNFLSLTLEQQFGSSNTPPGGTFSITLRLAGNVRFICDLHPNMEGEIRVR